MAKGIVAWVFARDRRDNGFGEESSRRLIRERTLPPNCWDR
jgi:hypothetical protein